MKTISKIGLSGILIAVFGTAVQAQSWHRPAKPHENSAYFNNGKPFNSRHHDDFSRHRYHDTDRDRFPIAFEVGCVSKRFGTNMISSGRYHENMWGEHNKFLNGFQMGFSFQPFTESHFGMRSGLFYEIYISNSSVVHHMEYNRFAEHDLYIPLHLLYHIPTASPVSIDVSTGFGFNIVMAGVYRSWGRDGRSDHQKYGNYLEPDEDGIVTDGGLWRVAAADRYMTMDERVENPIPDRVNAMWEIGCSVRYRMFKAGMNYGLGLNDQEFYEHARTRQNKFTFSLGVVF